VEEKEKLKHSNKQKEELSTDIAYFNLEELLRCG